MPPGRSTFRLDTDKPKVNEPNTEKAYIDEPSTDKANIDEPSTDKANIDEPSTDKANIDEPSTDKANIDESSTDKADIDEPSTDKAKIDESSTDIANIGEPDTDKANIDEPNTDKANIDESSTDKADIDEPSTDKANIDEPNTDKAKIDEPDTDKSNIDEQITDDVSATDENGTLIGRLTTRAPKEKQTKSESNSSNGGCTGGFKKMMSGIFQRTNSKRMLKQKSIVNSASKKDLQRKDSYIKSMQERNRSKSLRGSGSRSINLSQNESATGGGSVNNGNPRNVHGNINAKLCINIFDNLPTV
ncbi:unnamed protein product [Bemisia tabaci]|uniref:Uncharacterized protein n=1 Tax=Bemisia tabaci TaxID=7038 RepID=A0A9P0F834_BEMTA|nr:unnamed protein product [Bemisia tabaci]